MSSKRYTAISTGFTYSDNDLEVVVKRAMEKSRNAKEKVKIMDNEKNRVAGIVNPNGTVKRRADSTLGRSQNPALNTGVIKIDKDALREMIREAVAKKLGTVNEMRVRGSDKEVLKSFLDRNPLDGNKLSTDGNTLNGNWMGGNGIAQWDDEGKIRFNNLGSKAAQIVQNAITKIVPSNMVGLNEAKKDEKELHREKEKKDEKHKKDLKITKKRLKEAVAQATRLSLMKEAADLGIGSYSTKVDKLVSESIDSIDKLIEEGQDLMKENPMHDYAIQERNHLVQARIGILNGLKTQLVKIMEDLYRKL